MDLPTPAVEQVAEEARSHTREDGTLVIASDGSEHRPDAPDPPLADEGFKPEVQLGESAKAGLRAQPGRHGAVEALVNLTITF